MLKAILVRRLVAAAFTVAVTSVVPFIVQDRPRLSSAWGRYGPVIVDAAKEKVDDMVETHLDK